jgi:hypothetical protein
MEKKSLIFTILYARRGSFLIAMEPHGQSPWYLHFLRRNPPKHALLSTRLRRVILLAFIHGHRP